MTQNIITRRQFIRQAACAAVGTTAIASTLFDLRLIKAALAQGNFTDYKALVCVFLYGGNDSNNLLIPSTGRRLRRLRRRPAKPRARPEHPTAHRSDKRLARFRHASVLRWTAIVVRLGKLAILCNVGTLVGR